MSWKLPRLGGGVSREAYNTGHEWATTVTDDLDPIRRRVLFPVTATAGERSSACITSAGQT